MISSILKMCNNYKYKKNFIKYLSSLDFKEFEQIFVNYSKVISRLTVRYINNKPKTFSKKWFSVIFLENNFRKLYIIFSRANFAFVMRINNDLVNKLNKRDILLKRINENNIILNNISDKRIKIDTATTIADIIYFNILIIDNIYINEEQIKLIDEFNSMYETRES